MSSMLVTAERAPFVMLPRWLLYHREVGEGAKFLYCVLHDLVAGRQGPTRPVTRAELAERCGVSANTIDRRLAELVAVGAVDKQPQIWAGGQVGNVYHVWLTPPDQRPGCRLPTVGEARSERIPMAEDPPGTPVDNGVPTVGEARSGRFPDGGEPPREWGIPLPVDGDPIEEGNQEDPPQPPRRAGGPDVEVDLRQRPSRRRIGGTSTRAAGTNPRAESDRLAAARDAGLVAQRAADLEAAAAARRAADVAAAAEEDRRAAEALALSAALDDDLLAAVVARVADGLPGPLARSPLGVTREVLRWCRSAAATCPKGPVSAAVTAALVSSAGPSDAGAAVPLVLPPAPPGTVDLRVRVAALLRVGRENREPMAAAR